MHHPINVKLIWQAVCGDGINVGFFTMKVVYLFIFENLFWHWIINETYNVMARHPKKWTICNIYDVYLWSWCKHTTRLLIWQYKYYAMSVYFFRCASLENSHGHTTASQNICPGFSRSKLSYIIISRGPQILCKGPFYQHGSTYTPPWISNYVHHKVWHGISNPFPNKFETFGIWLCISNFIPYFIGNVTIYICWDLL